MNWPFFVLFLYNFTHPPQKNPSNLFKKQPGSLSFFEGSTRFFLFFSIFDHPPQHDFSPPIFGSRGHGSPINDGSHDHLETGQRDKEVEVASDGAEADTWRIIPGLVSG